MTRALSACFLGAWLVFAPALGVGAQELSNADKTAFRDIISAQIDAFRSDDGIRAFSFAAPVIRSRFQTPDNFMSMVRLGYPAVYRPQRVTFGAVTRELGAPTQKVHLIGPKGQAWTALYAMQRQDGGSWKISAVVIVREEGAGA